MSRIPPLLPSEALARVLRIARFDGMGVLFVSAFFAIISALGGDRMGAMVGLLVAAAGAIELHGATLLQHGDARGMRWLVVSQFFLMFVILGYCLRLLANVDITLLRVALTEEKKAQITALGWQIDEFLQLIYRTGCYMIAVLTVLYQGGMTLYYLRRRSAVTQALEPEES